jgi:hypothetical protein
MQRAAQFFQPDQAIQLGLGAFAPEHVEPELLHQLQSLTQQAADDSGDLRCGGGQALATRVTRWGSVGDSDALLGTCGWR